MFSRGRGTRGDANSAGERDSFTVVLAGDTSLGDWYLQRDGGEPLERLHNDPAGFVSGVLPLVSGADLFVANLETVLTDNPTSHLEGRKPYLGWDNPERSLKILERLGVDAVSLANNHTMDFGPDILASTSSHLRRAGISYFGAGPDQDSAATPFQWNKRVSGAGKDVYLLGAASYTSELREYEFFATEERWGINPLITAATLRQVREIRSQDPDALVILFPHWGRNYRWTGTKTWTRSQQFLQAGADLIVGHGAHMMQEIASYTAGTVVFSLGNFVFNSRGRYADFEAPPYSCVARLKLLSRNAGWEADLRLYPIVSDNSLTGYRPRPVDDVEAKEVYGNLHRRAADPTMFSEQFRLELDDRGWCIALRDQLSPRFVDRPADPLREAPKRPPRTRKARDAGKKPDIAIGAPGLLPNVYRHEATRFFKLREFESHVLEREALSFRLATRRFSERTFVAWDATGRAMEFSGPSTAGTSQLGKELMGDKADARALLSAAGTPLPQGRAFRIEDGEQALAYARSLGWPVIVKPVTGSGGKGVVSGITSAEEFKAAYHALLGVSKRKRPRRFLVEEHIDGSDYRFYVLSGKVISVLTRRPASVVGDGTRTIADLALQKNVQRAHNPHLRTRPLTLGTAARLQLGRQGLTLESVPAPGQKVAIASAANLSQGGESIEVFDEVHPSLMAIAAEAALAFPNMLHAGVDILIPDHRLPAASQRIAVCEVNASPGSSANDFPMYGTPRPVTPAVFREAASLRGVRLERQLPARSTVKVLLDATRCTRPTGYSDWMLERARELGVKVWRHTRDGKDQQFGLRGQLDDVAALVTTAIQGTGGARPAYVEAAHYRSPTARAMARRAVPLRAFLARPRSS